MSGERGRLLGLAVPLTVPRAMHSVARGMQIGNAE
jgi:hypothetical protein